jgi:hypothetical protein
MTAKVYELSRNLDRFEGWDEDMQNHGHLEREFEGYNHFHSAFFHCAPITIGGNEAVVESAMMPHSRWGGNEAVVESAVLPHNRWGVVRAVLPENIAFIGLREALASIDYPYIYEVNNWPIMSKRMVETILSVGDVPHQTVPVIFKSEDEFESSDEFGNIILSLNHDYVIFQLLELSDVLDMDKSKYDLEPYVKYPTETFVCNVKNPVLKEPESGFPSIFRVKNYEIPLYVSAKAKEALEEAGIQGLEFYPMDCS